MFKTTSPFQMNAFLVQMKRFTFGIIFSLPSFDNHSDICYDRILKQTKIDMQSTTIL